jgi:threonine dehydratase
MRLGVPATIFVPAISSPAKIARIRRYGARLEIGGDRYADALAACDAHVASSGALDVHAFDQPETLLGQGTLAMELEAQLTNGEVAMPLAEPAPPPRTPRDARLDTSPLGHTVARAPIDTVLVAVGGGGLIGGMAAWFRGQVRVIAVEPEGSPTLHLAMAAGKPVDAPAGGLAADSLAPRRVGELMFPIAQQFVDRVVLVDDDAIRAAQRAMWDGLTIVAEPGGSAALAALVAKRYVPAPGERVCVVVSGGNAAAVSL